MHGAANTGWNEQDRATSSWPNLAVENERIEEATKFTIPGKGIQQIAPLPSPCPRTSDYKKEKKKKEKKTETKRHSADDGKEMLKTQWHNVSVWLWKAFAITIFNISQQLIYQGFLTRMIYLYYISCLRYTTLVGNPRYVSFKDILM